MKKPQKRSERRRAMVAVDRMAQSLERAGIKQDRCVVRLAGRPPQRLPTLRKQLASVQNEETLPSQPTKQIIQTHPKG